MGLLGNGWDDPQSQANMALAAGLLKGDFGGGLLGASNAVQAAKENALKQQYMGVQMQNLQSEIAQRNAALKQQQDLMDMIQKRRQGGVGTPAQMGQLGSGSFGVVPPPAGMPAIPSAPQQPANGGSFVMGLGPDDAFLMKALGKDPTDIITAFKPKWENVGGNMVNTNDPNFRGGFVPQVKFDEKGGAMMLAPGANGMPQASIVPGSLEAYREFRKADAGIGAENDLVKVYNPTTGREEYVTRAQAVRAAQPQPAPVQPTPSPQIAPLPVAKPVTTSLAPQPGVRGNFVGDPASVMEAISAIRDPQERANAMAAFTEQAKRTGGFAQGAPFAAGPSAAETAKADANREQMVQQAKDVAEQRKSIMNAGFVAPSNIAKYQQIGRLLADVDGGKYTPAGTEFASALNSFGIKIDKNLPNKEAAASLANQAALELRNPASGAGMPGAMSDSDRQFLSSMTPNMAQSAQGRKMVIDAYIAVQTRNQQVAQFARKYEAKHGKLDNGFFDQLSAWSAANPLFKAQ